MSLLNYLENLLLMVGRTKRGDAMNTRALKQLAFNEKND
nr:hypothetical protein [Enterococcus faecium]